MIKEIIGVTMATALAGGAFAGGMVLSNNMKDDNYAIVLTEKEDDMNALASSLSSLNDEIASRDLQIENLMTSKSVLQKQYDELLSSSGEDRQKIERLNGEILNLQEQIKNASADKEDLQNQLNSKFGELSTLQQQVQEKETKIGELNKNISSLTGQVESYKSQVQSLQSQYYSVQSQYDSVNQQYQVLLQQSEVDKQQIQSLNQNISELNQRIKELESQIESVVPGRDELKDKFMYSVLHDFSGRTFGNLQIRTYSNDFLNYILLYDYISDRVIKVCDGVIQTEFVEAGDYIYFSTLEATYSVNKNTFEVNKLTDGFYLDTTFFGQGTDLNGDGCLLAAGSDGDFYSLNFVTNQVSKVDFEISDEFDGAFSGQKLKSCYPLSLSDASFKRDIFRVNDTSCYFRYVNGSFLPCFRSESIFVDIEYDSVANFLIVHDSSGIQFINLNNFKSFSFNNIAENDMVFGDGYFYVIDYDNYIYKVDLETMSLGEPIYQRNSYFPSGQGFYEGSFVRCLYCFVSDEDSINLMCFDSHGEHIIKKFSNDVSLNSLSDRGSALEIEYFENGESHIIYYFYDTQEVRDYF